MATPISHTEARRSFRQQAIPLLTIQNDANDASRRKTNPCSRVVTAAVYHEAAMVKQNHAGAHNFVGDALASLRIGIWSWRGSPNKVHCCPVAARLFNVPVEAGWNGLPLDSYAASVHPGDRVRFADLIGKARRTGGPFVAEYRTLDEAGTTHQVLDRGEFELGSDGFAVAARGLVVDMTDRPRKLDIVQSVSSTPDFRDLPPIHEAVEHSLALHRLIDVFPHDKRYAARVLIETLLEMLGREISETLDRDVYHVAHLRGKTQ